ncbi:MAG: glycosyltransferase family 4 protein [Pseudomonadota bacterium]
MMRVLITHSLFPPDFAGGGEYYVLRTAQQLQAQRIDVRVLTTGDPSVTEYGGIETVRLPIHPYRMNLKSRTIEEHARDVDLIHTFNYHAMLPSRQAARRLSKPVVCTVLGFFREAWLEMRGPLAGRAFEKFEQFLATRSYSKLVFLSDYSRDQCLSLGIDPQLAIVNEPGVDLDGFNADHAKENVALFVGKLTPRKGLDELVSSARALPHVHFRIVGWGPEEPRLRRIAPDNVEFLGFLEGQTLRDEFNRAQIFVLPSKAEGLPSVVLEAMAAGCAIVCTLPLDFSGRKVPVGDVGALGEAIGSLWADPAEAAELGRQNRSLAEQFTWDRHARKLIDVYTELV